MKKLAVIGTHGVVKTTLCQKLAEYATKQQKRSVKQIGEIARDCPFPINKGMCFDSAEWIILKQILEEKESVFRKKVTNSKHRQPSDLDLLICDRSSYDPYVYFKVLCKGQLGSNKVFQYALSHLWSYDLFVFVHPSGKEIEDDGVRDRNMMLQYKIHREFARDIEVLPAINKKLITISSEDIFAPSPKIVEEIYSCLF